MPSRRCIIHTADGPCLGHPETDTPGYPPICPGHMELFTPLITYRARRLADKLTTERLATRPRMTVADQDQPLLNWLRGEACA